ncbi:anti-sigma factor [Bacillus sp. MKU004]|nr:anti-sigma factor [Bacillus sp. MKU004]
MRRVRKMNPIKQEINKIAIPSRLHEHSVRGVERAKRERKGSGRSWIKKPLLSAVLAAALIVPTSAFAYQTLLADDLYGSFQEVKKHFLGATMEGYLLLDAKLSQAQGELGKEDYEEFKELLSVVISAKVDYGDSNGNIDYSLVPKRRLEELRSVYVDIQPYFDQLNGQRSSKEVLSPDEYEEYIDALMMYEQIMVQTGTKDPDQVEKIPGHLQEEFEKARNLLWEVNEKQMK